MCDLDDKDGVEVVQANSCEWCSMVLVEPVYRCNSGHEICGPCYSDVMYTRDVELERRNQGGGESEDGEEDYEGMYLLISSDTRG